MPINVHIMVRTLVIIGILFRHLDLYSKVLAIIAHIKVRLLVIIAILFRHLELYSKMLAIIAQGSGM